MGKLTKKSLLFIFPQCPEFAASSLEWNLGPLPPTSYEVYESLMQWQLFFSCVYLCKIWIFHFKGNLSVDQGVWFIVKKKKWKGIHCVKSKKEHINRVFRKCTVNRPYLFWQRRDVYCILSELIYFFLEDCLESGQVISIFPSQGAYQTFCCCPKDLQFIYHVRESEDI